MSDKKAMKVQVRHSEASDVAAVKEIYEEESGFTNTLQLPFPSLEKWIKFLNNAPENFYSLVACVDEKVVGQIGMEVVTNPRRRHVANIGMSVKESHRNLGVGSALVESMLKLAEDWLAIKRMELEVYTDNAPAIKLYKKFGFVVEGTATAYAFRNGQYADVYLMARVNNIPNL